MFELVFRVFLSSFQSLVPSACLTCYSVPKITLMLQQTPSFVRLFKEIDMHDVPTVGGKNASLGEMFQNLTKKGIRIPDGFATTADAFRFYITENQLDKYIQQTLKGLDVNSLSKLRAAALKVRTAILKGKIPHAMEKEIVAAYRDLSRREGVGKPIDVAVRSSATAEDLPGASFAGQQDTYLNIRGEKEVLDAVRRCFASLFTDRAIAYRQEKGFDHLKVALSCGVQKMVRSDKASAGVMFTIDTESGFRDVVLINAAWGLGESVVQGQVSPDQYFVFKPLLSNPAFDPIINRRIGMKEIKIIYADGKKGGPIKTVPVPPKEQRLPCLTDTEILTLAKWGMEIEKYYSGLAKVDRPMDIEWAKDGVTNKLYIVQARPETVQAGRDQGKIKSFKLKKTGKILSQGLSIGSAIGKGVVRVIKDVHSLKDFNDGDILVTRMTDPDWVPVMKRAGAIVTDSGGRTCHAAIVARELGTPAIVGTKTGTKVLKEKQKVTVSCAEGETGHVYEGLLPFEIEEMDLNSLQKPKTRIMMNIAQPDLAFKHSFIPNSGVGLARTEFIFTDYIKVHPLALMHMDKVDAKTRKEIDEITYPYKDKKAYFVDRLAEGTAMLAAAFYPNDVIVRMSDFKTNEYASLIGGTAYEPKESNPMIGWRGASRYYDGAYREAFLLECKAIKKVREEMGLENVIVMIPFCRTPKEGELVLKTMAEAGLIRGKKGLKVYVMVEIPSNIILADKFADLFDGFSIGSNDLTQLTLGVDRDSELVSHIYDEQNEAVQISIRSVIQAAKKKGIKIGICGQAPSDYPEFAKFLVREGIDSMSLNPDSVYKTTQAILKTEQEIGKK